MSDAASSRGTPIGETPATGGRRKQYANSAERARAWRERQRRTSAAADPSSAPAAPPPTPAAPDPRPPEAATARIGAVSGAPRVAGTGA
ncbi:hypothetical protein G6038_23930, partial [Rhodococcus sp. 14C212]|nr:hypothetical protein [Rhodococcus sp. 14C212]